MKKISYLLILSFVIVSGSCEKSDDKDNGDEGYENNNRAVLSGSPIGLNADNLEDLWREINVEIEAPSGEFTLGNAYVTRLNSLSSYVYWIIPVTNVSDDAYPFVKAEGIKLLDADDNLIYEDEFDYVEGSCSKKKDGNTVTSTYLRAGESGYFLGIENILLGFQNVEGITITNLAYSSSDYEYLNINVIPGSYAISGDVLEVNNKNMSDVNVFLGTSPYIFLDEGNVPLYWSYLRPENSMNEIEIKGGSAGVLSDFNDYGGNSSKIMPILDFELSPEDYKSTYLPVSEELSHDEAMLKMEKMRNSKLRALENQ